MHSQFTAAQRLAAIELSRHPPELSSGGIIVLRLRFDSDVPLTHVLPFCLATLPEGFDKTTVPDGSLVDFIPYFCASADFASGIWSQATSTSIIEAPLRAIMASGIGLTTTRKLKVVSPEKCAEAALRSISGNRNTHLALFGL